MNRIKTEIGGYRKRRGNTSFCLVYPNIYEVGIANLGFQQVYKLLNQIEGVYCERGFYCEGPFKSFESSRKLSDFSIIGFSFPYELDYMNFFKILKHSKIPIFSKDRGPRFPPIIAGGVSVSANPTVLAPFVDLFVIGEAEEILGEIVKVFINNKKKQNFLKAVSEIEGVYVPELGRGRIERRWVSDLNRFPTSSCIISPHSHFKNMYLVELERGCPYRCRFCMGGYFHNPYRVRDHRKLIEHIKTDRLPKKSIGLIGAAISEFPHLEETIRELSPLTNTIHISSLRLDRVSKKLVSLLVKKGLKQLTIAPETGGERLRNIIGKNIEDEKILEVVSYCSSAGAEGIKLYFMIGLPFETDDDVFKIGELIKEIRRIYNRRITVSINPFVPKPHTPFQHHNMEGRENLRRKMRLVENSLKVVDPYGGMKGIKVIKKGIREAILQSIVSRGDEKIGTALGNSILRGSPVQRIFLEEGIDTDFYTGTREEVTFPWDFIHSKIDRKGLYTEYRRAKESI